MSASLRKVMRTGQLIRYALFRGAAEGADPAGNGEPRSCEPREIRGGMGRFLDSRGELRLYFDGCYAAAAPFILFRLKREGFSRCSVEATGRGLLVRARR